MGGGASLKARQERQTPEPFFSFNYDGKPSSELLKTWELKRASRKLDDQRTEHTLTYTDPKTGLVVRCVGIEYRDYPCVEWTLFFKNTSDKDTPILSDIQALDLQVERKPGAGAEKGEFLLHHNAGSRTRPERLPAASNGSGSGAENGFWRRSAAVRPAADFSYFNLELSPDEGIIIAVGWPGQLATTIHSRQSKPRADSDGPGIDAFQAAAGRRNPLAAGRSPVLEGRRLASRPERLAAVVHRPQHAAGPAANCRRPNGAARPRSEAA